MAGNLSEGKEAIKTASPDSTIFIGCDSVRFKKNGQWFARYAIVMIIHHSSRHGASLYHEIEVLPDYGNLKQRLLTEVMFATNAALNIVDDLDGRSLEIHLDLNSSPEHKSNVAVSEAIGYVYGNLGFRPKIKPHSFAASHASDHCARGKLKV